MPPNLEQQPLVGVRKVAGPPASWDWKCWALVGCASIATVTLVACIVLIVFVSKCVAGIKATESIALPLVRDMEGGQFFTLANMSVIPRQNWTELTTQLKDTWSTAAGYSFGYASVDDTPRLLYEGSKVSGIFDKVPEQFRGVYWMRGNPLPEVLAVIQYARWFEQEQILLLPNTPWTWAWFGGASGEYPAPAGGVNFVTKATYTASSGRSIAESYTDPSGIDTVVSFRFSPCPEGVECTPGSTNLTYGVLMSHPNGDLSKHNMVYNDNYGMVEYQYPASVEPGALYWRSVTYFCVDTHTGYNLTKIIDKDGKILQPYYSDYVEFMNGKPLIIWSGFPENTSL